MRVSRSICAAAAVAAVMWTMPLPSWAWWSVDRETHGLMNVMSQDALSAAGLYDEGALFQGARDSDIRGLFQHLTHDLRLERSGNSFDAALGEARRGNRRMAVVRLARAFHYLQDHADPTKDMKSGQNADVRGLAYRVLAEGNLPRRPGWREAYIATRSTVRRSDIPGVFVHLARTRDRCGREIRAIFGRGRGRIERDREIEAELVKLLACIAACQDRMVAMFLESSDSRLSPSGAFGCAAPAPEGAHHHAGDSVDYWTRRDTGVKVGPYREWYDGERRDPKYLCCYDESGRRQGREVFWNRDGAMEKEYHYSEGMKHGPYRRWYADGRLLDKGSYWRNQRDGIYRSFSRDEKPVVVERYEKGKWAGFRIKYDRKGRRQSITDGSIEDGKFTGWIMWIAYESGRSWRRRVVRNERAGDREYLD